MGEGNSKGFTSYFNLVDNFSQKFDSIQKRITSVSGGQHKIDFSIRDSSIVKQTQDLGKKLQDSTAGISKAVSVPSLTTGEADKSISDLQGRYASLADQTYTTVFDVDDNDAIKKTQELGEKLQDSTAGISDAVENAKSVTAGYSDSQKEAGKAVDEHAAATQKAGNAISDLKGKYEGITGSLGNLKTALAGITGLIAGGSVAGFSWQAAEESDNYSKQVMEMLGNRKGTKKVDSAAISAFVAKATDSGYTSSTDRLQLTNLMIQRGAKTTGQATGAADALEKKYFANQEMLQKDYGVSSAQDLGSMATNKFIRGKQAKQDLDNLFGAGFSNKSQASRIKILTKQGVDIDINAAMAEHPLDVIQNRIKSITKSIGNELKGVMSPIAGMFAGILGIIDKNPIVPKILAISAVLAGVAGAIVTVGAMLPMLTAGFASLGAVVAIIASPIAILVALGALVIYLAYKTGVLQKAWEKFGQSSIGKDVMSALQGISDFVGGLIDQFEKWYDAGGSNQLLGYFFKLVDVLGTAWDYLDKLYAMTKTSTANPLIKALFLGIAAPATILAGLGAGAVKAVTGKDPAELLTILIRWVSNHIAPFMVKIHEVLKKVQSIFEWIYSLWQGALSWLKAGLGVTKKEKEAKLEKASESIAARHGNVDKNGNPIPYEYMTTGSGTGWFPKGTNSSGNGLAPNSGLSAADISQLNKAKERVDKAPKGFFEGIPGISALIDAILKLTNALTIKLPETPAYTNLYPASSNAKTDTKGPFSGTVLGPNSPILFSADRSTYTNTETGEEGRHDPDTGKYIITKTAEHAVGATFTRDGLFRGKVHAPEEIIPQSISQRGPGPIAKALDLLNGVTTGRNMPSAMAAGAGGDIHIHMPAQDFSGMKVSSSVEFGKVLRDANKKALADAVTEIRRTLGQGRT
jgi:hypothetical protein